MATDDITFEFQEWATRSGLNRKTTGAMVQEDMTTLLTLTTMSLQDMGHLEITRGQHSLIRHAVAALGNPGITDPQAPSIADGISVAPEITINERESIAEHGAPADHIMEAGAAFDRIWKRTESAPVPLSAAHVAHPAATIGYTVPTGVHAPKHGSGVDPRHALTIRAKSTKALKITDYVNRTVRERIAKKRKETLRLTETAAGTIQLKAEEDTYAIYLSQGEWAAANMCIMAHLLQSGELLREDVEYYMSYTAGIHNYTAKFEWQSIVEYDTQYREIQAEHQFMWGIAATYLEIQLLVPRQRIAVAQKGVYTAPNTKQQHPFHGSQHGTQHSASATATGQKTTVLCRLWANTGNCPYNPCKFDHPKRT